jgi:hypothetical protein
MATPHAPAPVGPSASRSAIQSNNFATGPEYPKPVGLRSYGIESHTSESKYRSFKVATFCGNRCASCICHIRLSRKTLQESLLHMISTEFSSLAPHKRRRTMIFGVRSRQRSHLKKSRTLTVFFKLYSHKCCIGAIDR